MRASVCLVLFYCTRQECLGAFAGTDSSLWGAGDDASDIDFGSATAAYVDPTDSGVQNLLIGNIIIPNEITVSSLTGDVTGALTGMRIAITMARLQNVDATTSVMADNLRLTRVPAPLCEKAPSSLAYTNLL